MRDRIAAVCLILLLSGAAGWAQSAPPGAASPPPTAAVPAPSSPASPSGDTRYTFNHVDGGYLRLDSQTGQVSLCSQRQVGWACQLAPDDRLVLDSEIARLQGENGRLKKELLSRGIALPKGVSAPPAQADSADEGQRAKQDLDRTLKTLTTAWTRFVEMIAVLTRNVMNKS